MLLAAEGIHLHLVEAIHLICSAGNTCTCTAALVHVQQQALHVAEAVRVVEAIHPVAVEGIHVLVQTKKDVLDDTLNGGDTAHSMIL